MNILDENFPEDQRALLIGYRLPVQQIGREIGIAGTTDENLLTLFHSLRRVTFFTQDQDFFRRTRCHPKYCLVWLDLHKDVLAFRVRQFLRHPRFRTWNLREGTVVRMHSIGFDVWRFRKSALDKLISGS